MGISQSEQSPQLNIADQVLTTLAYLESNKNTPKSIADIFSSYPQSKANDPTQLVKGNISSLRKYLKETSSPNRLLELERYGMYVYGSKETYPIGAEIFFPLFSQNTPDDIHDQVIKVGSFSVVDALMLKGNLSPEQMIFLQILKNSYPEVVKPNEIMPFVLRTENPGTRKQDYKTLNTAKSKLDNKLINVGLTILSVQKFGFKLAKITPITK
jgi:DNA-binding winged helix-turn-helix (wHTH) protein